MNPPGSPTDLVVLVLLSLPLGPEHNHQRPLEVSIGKRTGVELNLSQHITEVVVVAWQQLSDTHVCHTSYKLGQTFNTKTK